MITVKWDKNRHISVTPHRIIAVENENEVESVLFCLPKVVNGIDLSGMTVSFTTINNSGEGNIKVLPIEVAGAEVRLRWRVTREYTSVPGSLRYEIIFSDGETEFRTIRDFFSIVGALNAEDVVVEKNPAIIDQILRVYGDTVDLYNTLDVHISSNGHWNVNQVDTGVMALPMDGVSVQNASVVQNGHLILMLSDGKTIDAGMVKGEKGDAATVTIGTVTTGEAGTAAFVANAGSTSAAVFNFTIPRGAQGVAGRNFSVLSLYSSLADLQTEHPVGNIGDAYAVGSQSANLIYIWDVKTQNWTSLGSLYNTDRLEELLGIVPFDGGDFFEDYYNLDVGGGEF